MLLDMIEKIEEKIITFLPWEKIEPDAQQQIRNVAAMPFIHGHVAVMPDCHYGKGATVGTVIATRGAIIPAAVGVDIGCGMIAVKTNLRREDLPDLAAIRAGIERRIPMSAGKYNSRVQESAQERVSELETLLARGTTYRGAAFFETSQSDWRLQLGTLGGGNHFIELCEDEEGSVWATVHSGSRGPGNKIGNYYIKKAQALMDQYFVQLPDRDLAYLPEGTPEFDAYLLDLHWAQEFARHNRDEMMDRVLTELRYSTKGPLPDDSTNDDIEIFRINSHHNFTVKEHHLGKDVWVTRKGAVRARKEDRLMIPGSMGTRSYIVSGLENPLSFHSSPHGAGRRMSRNKAREMFSMSDLETAMQGIEFRKSEVLIDEIPGAYKDIDEVMENAKELVKVEYVLKQFLNCKGD